MSRSPSVMVPRGVSLQVKVLEATLSEMNSATVLALTTLMDLRDMNTGVHATRLAEWALRVAERMGVAEAEMRDIEIASMLHDIGKIGVPDEILNKPGKLTESEYDLVKKHPDFGWATLRVLPGFERVSQYVLHHHEHFDGSGYPAGLRGPDIPLGARIVSVVDAFDAMVASRPYRKGLTVRAALGRLEEAKCTQFDPEIVDLFSVIVLERFQPEAQLAEIAA